MCSFLSFSSLMLLIFLFLSSLKPAATHPHGFNDFHLGLAGRDGPAQTTKYPIPAKARISSVYANSATPCSGAHCTVATPLPGSLPCNAVNGSTFLDVVPDGTKYTLICDVDFPAQNIYPFVLAGSFDACLAQCEAYNMKNLTDIHCAGFVFAPDRINDADDCYLKSSLDNPSSATIHLVGATVIPSASGCSWPTASPAFLTPRSNLDGSTPSLRVGDFKMLGSSTNKPTTQYVSHVPASPQKLASSLLVPGINTDLITQYPIADDTGSWTSSQLQVDATLANMKVVPHMSRDGGKGGVINGTHLFIFCDTASFQIDQTSGTSQMVGFVSSSVATDDGMKALYGQSLDLVDNVGEWQDDVGRMRGFAPMTTGEESFNIDLSGNGYRYAVWPESSLIPLNASHALLYPALVYDVVDMKTQAAVFNNVGNSILVVSVDPTYGPSADRVVRQLYNQHQVAFGTLGGIRSWGSSGTGGNDGHIYLFGKGDNGVLVARANPTGYTDLSSYDYWNGSSWSKDLPSSNSNAVMLDVLVQDLDVIYVPALRSFVMVYLNTLADNTFYYRYLDPDLNADDKDFDVENIVKAKWSDEQVLAKVDAPAQGYIYAGGVHAGYFGADDVANGGWKMLITWTEHTGKDAASPESGYAHKSAGSLRHEFLNPTLKFSALSYEWGSLEPGLCEIYIDDMRYHVHHNLHRFWTTLLNINPADGYKNLWVDAICIDQQETTEKNHQVQQMKKIYQTAANVLVWLGPSANGSDELFDFLQDMCIPNSAEDAIQSVSQLTWEEWKPYQNKVFQAKIAVWKACEALCKRTYWTRTWILQEILLAKQPLLFCGNKTVPWQAWAFVLDTLDKNPVRFIAQWAPDIWGSPAMSLSQQWFASIEQGQPENLFRLIQAFRQCRCSVLHDKVYGVLGLLPGESTILVDYRREIEDLFLDLLEAMAPDTLISDIGGSPYKIPDQSDIDAVSEELDPYTKRKGYSKRFLKINLLTHARNGMVMKCKCPRCHAKLNTDTLGAKLFKVLSALSYRDQVRDLEDNSAALLFRELARKETYFGTLVEKPQVLYKDGWREPSIC
ncbi:hypothetical protein CLAIMM_10092 [Cladophialophora immunda]|nr:hypothetical protein CLAIMM_10092 [Cladophialophora immunda]